MIVSTFGFALLLVTYHGTLASKAGCDNNYATCSPRGASTLKEPSIGSALSSLYVDIVNTVDRVKSKRAIEDDNSELHARASRGSLCCAEGTQCLLLQDSLSLPFCYDNYTTNYFLPGGSYGQIASGNYSSDGSMANLLSGDFTLVDGTSGNIYGSSLSKPDTAGLAIPTQYTASGSGSAIPATALGQEITYTTTIPGTTVLPSILSTATTNPVVSAGVTVSSMTTTEPATTIPGTTVTPQVSTVTTRLAATASTKTGTAIKTKPNHSGLIAVVIVGFVRQALLPR